MCVWFTFSMPRLRLRLRLSPLALLMLMLGTLVHAQGNFEDADKANDYTDQQFDLRHTIPGEPGIDYPILSEVPKTSFVCEGRHEGRVESRQEFSLSIAQVLRFFFCPQVTMRMWKVVAKPSASAPTPHAPLRALASSVRTAPSLASRISYAIGIAMLTATPRSVTTT